MGARRWLKPHGTRSRTLPIHISLQAPRMNRSSGSQNASCRCFMRRPAPRTYQRCSLVRAGRMPMTRISSSCATTTISAASPRKRRSFHGLTYASASLTGIPVYHKAFDLPLPDVMHTSCPHFYRYARSGETESAFTDRMVAELESLIAREGPETIAAFIAEPIMGTGGVLLPPTGYFEKLQQLFEKHDILFIADEVITGFGRTGHWFATGGMNLKPDLVTLAKGITSAYFPVSACVISEKIWDVLRDASSAFGPVMHGFTYSGHPVGAALGLVNIDIMEREGLVEQAAEVGPYFQQLLLQRIGSHPHVGDVRGMGQMLAVEFVADKAAKRFFDPKLSAHRLVAARALEAGVLTRALPFIEVNSFSPPLSMSREIAEQAVERYGNALDAATADLVRLAELSRS